MSALSGVPRLSAEQLATRPKWTVAKLLRRNASPDACFSIVASATSIPSKCRILYQTPISNTSTQSLNVYYVTEPRSPIPRTIRFPAVLREDTLSGNPTFKAAFVGARRMKGGTQKQATAQRPAPHLRFSDAVPQCGKTGQTCPPHSSLYALHILHSYPSPLPQFKLETGSSKL